MQRLKKLNLEKDDVNVIKNIFLSFIVKGAAIIISFFSMPLYIKYFDDNIVLGLWYTILSILSWISVCELGLGNGLRNRLTEALTLGDTNLGRKYVSSTYGIIIAIIIPLTIIGMIIINVVDLNAFFNISSNIVNPETLRGTMEVLFMGISISFVLKIINNIIYAIQKASLNNFLALVTSVLPLLYVIIFNSGDVEKNLLNLSIVHSVAINLPLFIASIVLFSSKTLRQYRPKFDAWDINIAKSMLGFGMQFFAAELFFMFFMSTNEIMITKYFKSDAVVEYSIYYRLFTMVGSMFMLALTPIWSKVTKDLAAKKYKKIQVTNRILYILALIAVVAEFLLAFVSQWVINIWLRDEAINVNYSIAMIFALFGGLYILNIVLTTVANGIGNLKSQIVFYGIGSALKVPAILYIKNISDNWYMIQVYNCTVLIVFCCYQLVWIERKVKNLVKFEES